MRLTISLIQCDAAIGKAEETLAQCSDGVLEAGRRGSDLALLPELWHAGLDYPNAARWAHPIQGGSFAHMRQLAMAARVHLAGSAFERQDGRIYNTLAVFSPGGDLLGSYQKIHLFRRMAEERYLAPGAAPAMLDLPWGKTGLAICYDLRFPELFRRYALEGATLVLLPAQWPRPRLDHWRTLTQARAIENQCFLVACNRAGYDGDVPFGGHSCICDPWGERTLEAGSGTGVFTADIDLGMVAEVRARMAVLDDRQPSAYGLP
jgi:omega-amidase